MTVNFVAVDTSVSVCEADIRGVDGVGVGVLLALGDDPAVLVVTVGVSLDNGRAVCVWLSAGLAENVGVTVGVALGVAVTVSDRVVSGLGVRSHGVGLGTGYSVSATVGVDVAALPASPPI